MVMLLAKLSLLYSMKGGGPSMGRKKAVIGQLQSALGGRLMGKLSPGCLADTEQSH